MVNADDYFNEIQRLYVIDDDDEDQYRDLDNGSLKEIPKLSIRKKKPKIKFSKKSFPPKKPVAPGPLVISNAKKRTQSAPPFERSGGDFRGDIESLEEGPGFELEEIGAFLNMWPCNSSGQR